MSAFMSKPQRKLSTQLEAVLMILNADPNLMERVRPFINIETETISWEPLLKMGLGSGHRGAITWAYGIWVDEPRPGSNPFYAALSLDPNLQVAVLKALGLRWGLKVS